MKRTWPALLGLLLLAAQTAKAQFTYTTNAGTITITGYTGPGGVVTIPDSINGLPVTTIGPYAFDDITSLSGVIIPNTVTSIGEFAFEYCSNLTSLFIPSSVTNIGNGEFMDCVGLTGVYFLGNAPAGGGFELFQNDTKAVVYYWFGTSGWSSSYGLNPTVELNGQIFLTGLIQQGADQTGHSDDSPIWQTLAGASFAKIYLTEPNDGYTAAFLNSGNGASTSLMYALTPGVYEFYFFDYYISDNNPGVYGLNLFFNGNNVNPGISAYSPLNAVTATPVEAGQNTLTLDASEEVPATGSLTYSANGLSVTLTGYGYGTPGTFGGAAVDRVGNLNSEPDGYLDGVGVFTLTVVGVPIIVTQPQSQTVQSGTNATFTVSAVSAYSLSYQWYFDSNEISGATNAVLTVTNVQPTNAGTYSVSVFDPWGLATSTNATLTVIAPLMFQTVTQSNQTLTLTWNTIAGQIYQLQFKTNLTQPTWSNRGYPLVATNGAISFLDSIGPDTQRFYRVVQSP